MEEKPLYDRDFYQWTVTNADLLRAGRYTEADILNIIDEIESMGRSEKRALASRLELILRHLLKWQFQPDKRSRSWEHTISVQRREFKKLLGESPSLSPYLRERVQQAYKDAVEEAAFETNLAEDAFPKTCPFTLEQVLDSGFYPG